MKLVITCLVVVAIAAIAFMDYCCCVVAHRADQEQPK